MDAWLKRSGIDPGGRIPPERQIAAELGVTHYAINRAVGRLVTEGVLKREGYRLFYTPPCVGKSTAPYVYLAPNTSTNAKLAIKIARRLKYAIQETNWDSLESLNFILHRLCGQNPDGVIFEVPFSSHVEKWKPSLERLVAANIPCVCVLQSVKGFSGMVQDYGAALVEAFAFLVKGGHTEMALLSVPEHPQSALDLLNGWDMQCRRHDLQSSLPRVHVGMQRSKRADARVFAKLLAQEWENVTGLIAQDRAMIPHLLEELASRKRFVPKDISIICIGDEPYLKTSTPPVSCITFDDVLCMESAFRLLDWIVEKKASTGKLPKPQTFKLQPQLTSRGSISPQSPEGNLDKPGETQETSYSGSEQWPDDPAKIRHLMESIMGRPYPLTVGTRESRFQQISLKKHLNRPLNYRRGWLGDLPLRNLGTGKQRIHGIVFNIENEQTRATQGAVVFRSLKNSTGCGKPLPERIKVKVGCHAKAIYILHSCGFATFLNSFARYDFHSRSGIVDSVPLVVLGERPHEMNAKEWNDAISKANIQDWWPDCLQTDFTHAKRAIVAQDKETLESHRYIYTLEWVNPHPEEEVDFVEIRVDPMQPTTLGIIAMSVFKG